MPVETIPNFSLNFRGIEVSGNYRCSCTASSTVSFAPTTSLFPLARVSTLANTEGSPDEDASSISTTGQKLGLA